VKKRKIKDMETAVKLTMTDQNMSVNGITTNEMEMGQ